MTAGQGSPQVKAGAASRRTSWQFVRFRLCSSLLRGSALKGFAVVLAAVLVNSSAICEEVDQPVSCELRIVWGGDTMRSFEGTISVDSGTIRPVRNLSLQADAIGKVQVANSQTISILPHSQSSFGGVDVAVQGSLSTRLAVQMVDPFSSARKHYDLALRDLLQGRWLEALDERGNRIAIERQTHDRLRIKSDREQHIFEGGESWKFSVEGCRTGLPAGQYTIDIRILQDSELVGESPRRTTAVDVQGEFAPIDFDLPIPEKEGAYRLEIAVHRRNYLNSFVSTGQPLVRRLDWVVVNSHSPPPGIVGWKPLAAIDPLRASKPGSLAWLSSFDMRSSLGIPNGLGVAQKLQPFNPLAGSLNQPVGNGPLGSREIVVRTDATEELSSAHCLTLGSDAWIALPLTGLTRHAPHRIRVIAPTDHPMELAVRIQQSNTAGESPAFSLDSGIIVRPRQVTEQGELAVHEVVFWPHGDKAHVLLANTGGAEQASVLDVQLEMAELMSPELTPEKTSGERPALTRMIGFNLDKPLLADCVSASREQDPVTGQTLESWATWHQSVTRICQLMDLRNANTLLLTGFSEASAIFPSDRLNPSRRFDNGTFFSDGRSTDIKDAVELMLRHFDRANYRLILALDLDSALPNLSRFENAEGEESLMQQPIGNDLSPSQKPRYNPLNARVQEEMIAVLREIVDRYGHHRAFAGIAIRLDNHSQLLFAGDRWGYDVHTLQAFEKFAQLSLPPRDQLETVFSGPARLAFLEWRAEELTKFYARLGDVVARDNAHAKLYLNAIRLWDVSPVGRDFYNPDAIIRNPREYMLAFGISPERLAKTPRVELMRGSSDALSESVNSQDWIRRESGQRGLVEYLASADAAAVVLRYPRRHALAASEKLTDSATHWIYPTLFQPHERARQKLVNQVFHSDPLVLVEGGWLPTGGQDQALLPLYRTLYELPPIKLNDVSLSETDTNLCVRLGKHGEKTYLQLVNNAPWAERLEIGYQELLPQSPVRVLGQRQIEIAVAPNRWSLVLDPYDMIGIEISDPRFTLTSFQHSPLSDILPRIANELAELEALVSQSADPAQQKLLAEIGGDFENWTSDGQPNGWSVSSLPRISIVKSLDLPHTGKASLLIENQSKTLVSAWIQSRPIEPPQTGRLAVQAWLRAPAVGEPLLVRLSIVGRTRTGQRFERSAQFGARSEGGTAIAFDWGRKPATLYVSDISAEAVTELYVSIELIGPGKVWVDDVQVLESFLHPEERNHLRGQLLVAKQKLNENNPYPAEQLLDSHWGHYLFRVRSQSTQNEKVAKASERNASSDRDRSTSPRSKWSESPSVFRQFRESLRDQWRR